MAETAIKKRPATTGALIDQLWAIREEKRRINEMLSEADLKYKEVEEQLIARLDDEGVTKATGSKASTSVSSNTVASVADWDLFWAYIIKNKYTHLLHRRVSDPAYRELLEAGKKVPGVEPFTKRSINLRTL